jgi:carboxylesterase
MCPSSQTGHIGVLLSHGFTGTPMEMRPLAEAFASAGYTVALPRLAGHGTTPEDMATTTANAWVASIADAATWLQARCDRLLMVGLSMGGILSLYMAGLQPTLFAGIITINAPMFFNNPQAARLALAPGAPAEIPLRWR